MTDTTDTRPSIAELQEYVKFMSPVEQYKAEPSWNNGGMPLADFTIPGHNGGATVEMLADDAQAIVELRVAAPVLLEIAAAALAANATACDCSGEAGCSEECSAMRACRAFESALAKVRP